MDPSAEQKALLQCIAVCCSVLQCVAVRCSALQFAKSYALVHLLSYRHALPVKGKQRQLVEGFLQLVEGFFIWRRLAAAAT